MSYMNRRGNARNPYQGDTLKVLCVCSAGLLRSPTCANVLHQEYGYNTRAAGANGEYALVPVDAVLCEWADEIVFMEKEHYDLVRNDFADILQHKRVLILNVPDKYEWNHPELRRLIQKQYEDTSIMEKAHV